MSNLRFIKQSGLPASRVGCVVLSPQYGAVTDKLHRMGIETLHTASCERLLPPERYHADLLLRHLGGNTVLVESGQLELMKAIDSFGGKTQAVSRPLEKTYPYNIALNALICGESLFGKLEALAPELLTWAHGQGQRLKKVRQGYAGCACALVNERAILTSDKGIAKAAGEEGIDCLLLTPGHIRCDGFDCGFIGGCCGKLAPDLLAFVGELNSHPDETRIREFCHRRGVDVLSLTDGPLCDIGGIIPLMEEKKRAVSLTLLEPCLL